MILHEENGPSAEPIVLSTIGHLFQLNPETIPTQNIPEKNMSPSKSPASAPLPDQVGFTALAFILRCKGPNDPQKDKLQARLPGGSESLRQFNELLESAAPVMSEGN